jgi:hypothetical protein
MKRPARLHKMKRPASERPATIRKRPATTLDGFRRACSRLSNLPASSRSVVQSLFERPIESKNGHAWFAGVAVGIK